MVSADLSMELMRALFLDSTKREGAYYASNSSTDNGSYQNLQQFSRIVLISQSIVFQFLEEV